MEIILWAIPVFILTLGIEMWVLHRREDLTGFTWKDSAASVSMGLGNVAVMFAGKAIALAVFTALYSVRFVEWDAAFWGTWVVLFFADDFCYYWFHRLSHSIRFFWAAHVNHHSSTHYNLSTALRQSWTGPLITWVFWIPLPLLGFHPAWVLLFQSTNLLYQYWIHTEVVGRLGVLEWVFNSPSHHRVHHGSNPLYLDRNHGGILIIWDRIFGTFEEEVEAAEYGLTRNIQTHNPIEIAFHEWRSLWADVRGAASLRDAIGYLVHPPGWKPGGLGTTSEDLRRHHIEAHGSE